MKSRGELEWGGWKARYKTGELCLRKLQWNVCFQQVTPVLKLNDDAVTILIKFATQLKLNHKCPLVERISK